MYSLRDFSCIFQPKVEYVEAGRSNFLDHVSEVVYLVKQIDLTKKTQEALEQLDAGNKESMQVHANAHNCVKCLRLKHGKYLILF